MLNSTEKQECCEDLLDKQQGQLHLYSPSGIKNTIIKY